MIYMWKRMLLADVFVNFRGLSMTFFGLGPCHFISLPSLAWNGLLNKTEIKLEQLTDVDMYLFFEQGIRGEMSYIKKRYAKANNKYMFKYDE